MNRRLARLSGFVALFALYACGQPVGQGNLPNPDWGQCGGLGKPEVALRNVLTIPDIGWLHISASYAETALAGAETHASGDLIIDTTGAEPVTDHAVPERLRLHFLVVEHTREAVGLGADLMVGYLLKNSFASTEVVLALMSSTDTATLLLPCSVEQTEQIRVAAVASGVNSEIEFVERAAVPGSAEQGFIPQPVEPTPDIDLPTWYELDPNERSLDPSDAPPEIVEQLRYVPLLVQWPSTWSGVPGRVCARNPLGWAGICVETDNPSPIAILYLVIAEGEPAEIWIKTPTGQAPEGLVLLASFEPDVLAAIPKGSAVSVSLGGKPTSAEEAQALVSSGEVVVEVLESAEADALVIELMPPGVPVEGP